MKKLFLYFIFLLLCSITIIAVPVTYTGTVEYNDTSTNILKAVSATGTTQKEITQTDIQTNFVLNHLANPGEDVEFYFNDIIVKRHMQPKPATIVDIGTVLVDVKDSDRDGIADDEDNCPYAYNSNQNNICINDIDNDGINDSLDFLIGDKTHITTNIPNMGLMIDNDFNLSKPFSGEHNISIKAGNDTILEFSYDFNNNLTLSDITILKQFSNASFGSLFISGLNLYGNRKTVYVDRVSNEDYVCVKDLEISSVTELPSTNCDGNNEIPVYCDGNMRLEYVCNIINNRFKVSGLKHSGIIESSYTPKVYETEKSKLSSSSSGGGGSKSESIHLLPNAQQILSIKKGINYNLYTDNEKYVLRLNKINDDSIKISLKSYSNDESITLYLTKPYIFNINHYNLNFELLEIKDYYAKVKIIYEEIKEEKEEKIVEEKTTNETQIIKDETKIPEKKEPIKDENGLMIIMIITIIVIIVMICSMIFIIIKKKDRETTK